MPMVNYINGMGLRRITLQGDGTKKSPYRFVSGHLEVGALQPCLFHCLYNGAVEYPCVELRRGADIPVSEYLSNNLV